MNRRGFTLIELLVVLVVLAVLTAIIAPNYLDRVSQAREVTLKHNLVGMRSAIDQFHRDKGRYPDALQELVDARYVRAVPEDPLTQRSDTWVVIAPSRGASSPAAAGKVFDVRSGAPGQASDGSAFSAW
ncbi:MAG TPA: prepilin-type N-terminal cleavage/methylation domain-containing protein [Ramlibacter sp.]|nr:prepilin-type N-terminal cleavage/methylation domain-containing protein [Ramlibacter sp.]